MLRVEARVDPGQPAEAAHQEARPDQQHHRERHLGDDQRAAQPGVRGGAPHVLEQHVHRGIRGPQRRENAEAHAGQERDGAGEAEGEKVEVDLLAARQVRQQRSERVEAPGRERDADRAAGERQEGALGEELPHHAPAAGAERDADGDLALPRGGAREHEVADVGSGDQEHERDRAPEDEQRRFRVLDLMLLEQLDVDGVVLVGVGIQLAETARHGVERFLDLRDGHSRPHPGEAVEAGMAAALLVAIGEERERHEEVGAGEKAEVLGQHAESAFPKAVHEDHGAGRAGLVVVRAVQPAEDRLDAEFRQEVCARHAAEDALRLAVAHQVEALAAHGGEVAEEVGRELRLPVGEVEPGDRGLGKRRHVLADQQQPIRLGERQRPQEREADHAEQHRVRADAERERERRDGRESWRLAQGPDPVADVLNEAVHPARYSERHASLGTP